MGNINMQETVIWQHYFVKSIKLSIPYHEEKEKVLGRTNLPIFLILYHITYGIIYQSYQISLHISDINIISYTILMFIISCDIIILPNH
jgi:hypothetical protein